MILNIELQLECKNIQVADAYMSVWHDKIAELYKLSLWLQAVAIMRWPDTSDWFSRSCVLLRYLRVSLVCMWSACIPSFGKQSSGCASWRCLWRQSSDPSVETYLIALHTWETPFNFCDLWVCKEWKESEERKGCFLHCSRTASLIQHWNNEGVSSTSPLTLVGSFYFKFSCQYPVPATYLAEEWQFWVDWWVQ